ncbi:MAG TPA: peptide-methionine (S)-S-oxide reductase MsrA [Sulfurimonas sp.]|jgi:peptide-methionine (S)-S-oxide reductase|nr:peptide-methionine (S)-S-oxide reductase MsrA [Sulfurimonas sp.]HIM75958.1 peptide-methionine (S)-S-oxide reductase [Campylobacterales bacterium]
MSEKRIVLGGGCFWCTEAVYLNVKGVISVESGYAGGNRPNPNYQMICTGVSGYAEVIDIRYDEDVINLSDLLDIFFVVHNPTTLNSQGGDKGTQYRSVVYYTNDLEHEVINDAIQRNQANYEDTIVTEVSPLPETVYPAEDYHQNYYALNSSQAYCQAVIAPKLQKFMISFPEKLG